MNKSFLTTSRILFTIFTVLLFCPALKAECVFLKQLQAIQKGQDNMLTWSTLSERDNAFFLIERSLNGINFEEAGRVEGAGNSKEVKAYSFSDIDNPGLRVFYRLAEVDMTGKVKFTNTVLINRKGDDIVFEITSIESSITDHYFNLTLNSTVSAPLEYRLQTRMGEILKVGVTEVVSGQNAISIDLHDAESGSYQFSLRVKNEIEVIALQKVEEAVVPESILSIKDK